MPMPLGNLVAVAAACALGWAQTAATSADENPATVQGTVTNALTGEPVLRARVLVRGTSGRERKNINTVTDAEGKFSVSVPSGFYSATAERLGYTSTADRQG